MIPDGLRVRNEWDKNIFRSVALLNEYKLPNPLHANSLVVDIGSHIGSFCWAAYWCGAKKIYAVEASRENSVLLEHNVSLLPSGTVRTALGAAWNSTDTATELYEPLPPLPNTGGGTVFSGEEPIRRLPINQIIQDAIEWSGISRIALLKLDCEGSEYPICLDADLSLVDSLCGEAHGDVPWKGRTWQGIDLKKMFQDKGFKTHFEATGPGTSLFWASREDSHSISTTTEPQRSQNNCSDAR